MPTPRETALARAASWRGGSSSGTSPTLSSAGVVPYGNLATDTNALMTQAAQQPYISNLPNYQAMVGQQSQNTLSQLQGEVPDDVVTQLLQRGAERGIITGSPGSPNSNAAFMRALGLTSIGQQATGAENLSRNIANTPVSPLFNPASLFVPEHLARLELEAAQAGMGSGGGGVGGGSSIRLPGAPLVSSAAQRTSPNYTNPPAVGSMGVFTQPAWQQPAWYNYGNTASGNQGSSFIGTPGNYFDEIDWAMSNYGDPSVPTGFSSWDAANQFSDDLYADFDNIEWG